MGYQIVVRPINERERAVLLQPPWQPSNATLLTSLKSASISVVVASMSFLLFLIFMRLQAAVASAAIVMVVLVFASFTDYLNRTFPGKRLRRFEESKRSALANGFVTVQRVEAKNVIGLDEIEDEGPTYYFDVGDGKILCLRGQEMYEVDQPWPNKVFEIVSTTDPELYLGIFCYGEELKPLISTQDWEAYPDIPEGISSGSLDAIADTIKVKAKTIARIDH